MAGRKYARGPATIGGIVVDAVTTETHTAATEVTEHPIEQGANVNDHMRNRALELTMECVVSDTPFSLEQIRRTREANGTQFLSTADAEVPAGGIGNGLLAYNRLMELREARQPILVTTVLRDYKDMGIVSITVPIAANTGDALVFTITLKQLTFVSLDTATVSTEVPRVKGKGKGGSAGSVARAMIPTPTATSLKNETIIKGQGGYEATVKKALNFAGGG